MSSSFRPGSRRRRSYGVTLAILAVALVAVWLDGGAPSSTAGGDAEVRVLFEAGRSGEMVTVEGVVERVLPPDDDGSPHQRFIVELASGQTLLIAHNLVLAEAVPLREGDPVRVHGEYEWNDRGGLLHWTHHDPEGRRAGGWIEHRGERYR